MIIDNISKNLKVSMKFELWKYFANIFGTKKNDEKRLDKYFRRSISISLIFSSVFA